MARDFQSLTKKLVAKGLDQFSAKASVKEGYAEDLVNVDTNASGSVSTRKGFEGYYGWLPWRVKSVQAVEGPPDKLRFTLRGSDLSNVKVGPLVVKGRLDGSSVDIGDFQSDTEQTRYYPGFRVLDKVVLTPSVGLTGTLVTTANEHGQSSSTFGAGFFLSDSTGDRDNSLLQVDEISVNDTTYEMTTSFSIGSESQAYLGIRDLTSELGVRYHWSLSPATGTVTASGDTLTSASHGLSVGDLVEFTTSGSLPAGLSALTLYFVVEVPSSGTFKVSLTEGGSAVTTTTAGSGTHTFRRRSHSVNSSTHNLDNFNIVPFFFRDLGATTVSFQPAEFTLSTSGTCKLVYGPCGSDDVTGTVVLEAAETENSDSHTFNAGSLSHTFSVSDPFTLPAVYFYDSPNARYTLVVPDSWVYTETPGEVTVSYTTGVADEVFCYWVPATVTADTIEVDSITNAATATLQTDPQLTLWGLDHENAYRTTSTKGGHVTGLDSYRTSSESRLVAALGGNLYKSSPFSESASSYLLEQKYVRNNARLDNLNGLKLAPLFWDSDPGSVRTRGVIYDSTVQNNLAVVSSCSFISTGVVSYTLSFTGKTGTLALGTQVDSRDYLEVSGLANPEHTGSWRVQSVVDNGATEVVFTVLNPNIVSALTDETGAAGSAGVFSDRIRTEEKTLFVAGDTLLSSATEDFENEVKVVRNASLTFTADAGTDTLTSASHELYVGDKVQVSSTGSLPGGLSAATDYYIVTVTASTLQLSATQGGSPLDITSTGSGTHTLTLESGVFYVDGWDSSVSLPDGLQLTVSRTSALVPVGDVAGGVDYDNVLRGDMLEVSGLARKVRVLGVQTRADQTVTAVSGTFTSPLTHRLNEGDTVLLTDSTDEDLQGEFVVESVPTTTTFTLEGVSGSGTATLNGSMILLDEALETQGGSSATSFTPEGRWVPVEAPSSSYDLPKDTYYRHLDANYEYSQPLLKSTSLGGKLFFSNGDDEVLTFDGTSVYRAGLPRWQPFVFASNLTSGGSLTLDKITEETVDFSPSANTLNKPTNTTLGGFNVGDPVKLVKTSGGDTTFGTVVKVQDSETSPTVTIGNLTAAMPTASGTYHVTVTSVSVYKYYFRLQLIDAQDNVISSAMTGANDCVVRYSGTGAIQLKLVGLPALDNYDYDRITVEVYRTVSNGNAFYFLTTKEVSFDNGEGYIIVLDEVADETLEARKDYDTLRVLKPRAELGTGWQQPVRAKHVSSASGRLILANLKDYPKLRLNFESTGSNTVLTAANLAGSTKLITFRKDNTDTSTTTNMVDRVRFEFLTASTAKTVTNVEISSGVATLTSAGHGYSANSWVYLYHSSAGNNNLTFSGWHQLSSVTTNTFSFKTSFADIASAAVVDHTDKVITSTAGVDVPVLVADDYNYNTTLNQTTTNFKFRAGLFLANAINSVMRQTDVTLTGQTSFVPWLTAQAGSDFSEGEVLVEVTKGLTTTPHVKGGSSFDDSYSLYANDILLVDGDTADFVEKRHPSRMILSYPNYAEIFDNPTAVSKDYSDSLVDVNPEDGQEITAVISFFGTSTSSAAQMSQILVVLKTNSVYTYDIGARDLQKLDSRGLGCTAPASVANGREAIYFANESGVCRLTRDMKVELLVDLTKFWKGTVNRDSLSVASGHHYGVGRRYKLSVPTSDDETNSQVLVYDYEPEDHNEPGGWTRYTNHNTTLWCNLVTNAFWGSTEGDVFLVRDRGEASDYRDEDQAVAESQVLLRAEDFGVPGLRKVVQNVMVFLDLEETATDNLRVYSAMDLSSSFALEAEVSVALTDPRHFRVALASRRGNFVQLKFVHQTKDQQFTLASLAYTVGQLNYKLAREAARDA